MITTTIEQWMNVLDKTGITYRRIYNHLVFNLWHHHSIDPLDPNPKYFDSKITVVFGSGGKFVSIHHEKFEVKKTNERPQIHSTALLSDWTNLLKNSDIYYALKSFTYKNRWSTYWLEFPISDTDNSGKIAMHIAYDRRNHEIFAVSSSEIY
jgi:hypothetical protein